MKVLSLLNAGGTADRRLFAPEYSNVFRGLFCIETENSRKLCDFEKTEASGKYAMDGNGTG